MYFFQLSKWQKIIAVFPILLWLTGTLSMMAKEFYEEATRMTYEETQSCEGRGWPSDCVHSGSDKSFVNSVLAIISTPIFVLGFFAAFPFVPVLQMIGLTKYDSILGYYPSIAGMLIVAVFYSVIFYIIAIVIHRKSGVKQSSSTEYGKRFDK